MADIQGASSVYVRNGMVLIEASSIVRGSPDAQNVWRGMRADDWEAFERLLLLETSDDALGGAVREAIRASRLNLPDEFADARQVEGLAEERFAEGFRLNSMRNVYDGMLHVYVDSALGEIILSPSRRVGKGFDGFRQSANKGHEDIVISDSVSDRDIGAALRQCIARCL